MINKISNFIKRNKTFFRILISFIILFSLILSVLSFLIYTEYSESSIKDLYTVSADMLNQNYISAESQLSSVYDFFARMYLKDNLVFNALYTNSFKGFEMYDINSKLVDAVRANPIVESVYIYNKKADIVFSNKTTAQKILSFYDQDILKYISMSDSFMKTVFIPRKVSYSIYEEKENVNLITIIFSESEGSSGPDSALIVNINQAYLSKIFSIIPKDNTSLKIIVNNKGNIIVHNDLKLFGENISSKSFYKKIQSSSEEMGYFTINENNEKSFVSYFKSGKITGWYFISIVKYKNLVSRIESIRNKIFQFTGIFIIFSLLISIFFILRIYKPIRILKNQIKSKGVILKYESNLSEFDYINEAFNYLNNNVLDLKVSVNNYKLAKKNQFLEKIIRGEVKSEDKLKEETVKLDIKLDSIHYLVCLIRIDAFNEFTVKYSPSDVALYRFAISNIASEILQQNLSVEVVDGTKDFIILLFKINEIDEEMKILMKSFVEIQQLIEKHLEISTTVAIGSIVDAIIDIHTSYLLAFAASDNRIIYGRGAIINYNQINLNKSESFSYPFEIEKKILDGLIREDIELTGENIEKFTEYVCKYTYDEIMLSLTQLSLVIIKSSNELFNIDRNKLGLEYQNMFNQMFEYDTLFEIKEWLLDLCSNIILILQQRKDNKNEKTIDRVVTYIDENYQNSNLTIETIAEMVELSPNHLRLIFREMVGKSLSRHINKVRMINAQRLLKETDYPATRIAQMVGFINTSYFYTNFKNYTGRSPEKYREEKF